MTTIPLRATRAVACLLFAAVAASCGSWTGFGFDDRGPELFRIRQTLELSTGSTVADVGAGRGGLSVALAKEVGPAGRVFATDVDRARVEALRDLVHDARLSNVEVVVGDASDARLPASCCDAIVLRRVYHHLTDPAGLGASLLQALKSGGMLAVIDFPPPFFLRRGDFGVPADAVIAELTRSGFELVRIIDDWPGRGPLGSYCLLFRKPR